MIEKDIEENQASLVVKGVTITGIGNLIMRFLDFFIAVFLLRWLTVFEYGTYRLILAAYDFAAGFFLAGLENVVVSDASGGLKEEPRRAKTLFSVYTYFTLLVGVLFFLIFFFGSELVSKWFGGGGEYLRIISFLFLISPLESAFKLRFHILLDFAWETIFRVFRDFSRLGAILAFYFLFSFGTREAILTLMISYAAPVVLTFLFYHRHSLFAIPSFSEARQALESLFFRHGKWALLEDFLSNSGKNVRPFIIKFFVGTEAVALFSAAQSLVANMTSIFPIRDILTPVLPRYADRPARLSGGINRAIKYSIFAYTLIGIVGAIAAPFVIFLLFPKYLSSLPIFYVFLLGLPFTGFRSVVVPVFYALKAQKILFLLTALRIAFIVGVGITLTYLLGLWGAVIEATLLGYFITPALARALRTVLPQWRFSLREIFKFDAYDRELLGEMKYRIAKRFGITN